MVTPSEEPGNARLERREQILRAARAAIEEFGPEALTGDIAKRAGLARPNVYRHFSSKDNLDLAVARSTTQELLAAIREQLDLSGTPLDVIRAPIKAQVIWADCHPNLYRFLVSRGMYQFLAGQGSKRRSKQRGAEHSGFASELTAVAARYFPRYTENPYAAEATVIGVAALIDASVLHWLDRRTELRDELIGRLTDLAWLVTDHHLCKFGVQLDPARPLPQTWQTPS
ncbi:MAG TPA: TetR/AcrR family transcriptional regulator [Acetobacteraceae bacterium]|jgi:AcrR family transcriptional regulator|nr:TetR/AcrR family transcriptional regulator [Acetobacteraceae bacterium]